MARNVQSACRARSDPAAARFVPAPPGHSEKGWPREPREESAVPAAELSVIAESPPELRESRHQPRKSWRHHPADAEVAGSLEPEPWEEEVSFAPHTRQRAMKGGALFAFSVQALPAVPDEVAEHVRSEVVGIRLVDPPVVQLREL